MNEIRKPLIDYMEYDCLNTWTFKTLSALEDLVYEIQEECGKVNTNIEETLKDFVTNIYAEAFRDGADFRRWLEDPSFKSTY